MRTACRACVPKVLLTRGPSLSPLLALQRLVDAPSVGFASAPLPPTAVHSSRVVVALPTHAAVDQHCCCDEGEHHENADDRLLAKHGFLRSAAVVRTGFVLALGLVVAVVAIFLPTFTEGGGRAVAEGAAASGAILVCLAFGDAMLEVQALACVTTAGEALEVVLTHVCCLLLPIIADRAGYTLELRAAEGRE